MYEVKLSEPLQREMHMQADVRADDGTGETAQSVVVMPVETWRELKTYTAIAVALLERSDDMLPEEARDWLNNVRVHIYKQISDNALEAIETMNRLHVMDLDSSTADAFKDAARQLDAVHERVYWLAQGIEEL